MPQQVVVTQCHQYSLAEIFKNSLKNWTLYNDLRCNVYLKLARNFLSVISLPQNIKYEMFNLEYVRIESSIALLCFSARQI